MNYASTETIADTASRPLVQNDHDVPIEVTVFHKSLTGGDLLIGVSDGGELSKGNAVIVPVDTPVKFPLWPGSKLARKLTSGTAEVGIFIGPLR
mgnify:CR=1 FL=1